jgi:integrase
MPSAGGHDPDPPTPEQAAALLNLAFAEDDEFGLFCWTAFTTGGRRGELLGLREDRIDFTVFDFWFRKNYVVKGGQRVEKAPKTGKGRHVSTAGAGAAPDAVAVPAREHARVRQRRRWLADTE